MEHHSAASHESFRLQVSKMSGIAGLGTLFSKAVSVDHLLSLILKEALDLMSADVCIIWLKDSSGNLVPRISFGLSTNAIRSIRVKVRNSMVRCIMEKGRPTYVHNLGRRDRFPIRRLARKEGLVSLLAMPLTVEDEDLGVLMICSRSARRYNDADMKVFNAIARQSALAIATAGLYERMEGRVREKTKDMAVLFSMSRSISSTMDLDELLNIILEKTRLLLKARFCSLKLLDRSRTRLTLVSAGKLNRAILRPLSHFENEMSRKVIRRGIPIIINGVKTHVGERVPPYLKRYNINSIVMAPLFSSKRKTGVLSVYISDARIFRKEDIDMLEMIASLCSIAIDNATMLDKIKKNYLNTIRTLAKIIDENDAYTRGHCDKVMRYSLSMCRKLNLPPHHTNSIKIASLLHDIGKVGVDISLLRKTGSLTKQDWEKMRLHPEIGANIVRQAGFLNDIVPIIKHHHARFSGGGYPDPERLGEKIPLGARILAVADSYDAMTSVRPYRSAMSKKDALQELKKCAGTQFDPKIVDVFLSSGAVRKS